jgi:ABC-type transport system involved in multi-copper enzyme maturation permease subunit
LVRKELRELAASRSYWLLLVIVGLLVGHAFSNSLELYNEASGAGGGPAALAQGLTPLEGIVVPTFGAYDLAATLLLPFVVIRLVAGEKQSGELALTLQSPASLPVAVLAKAFALTIAWIICGVAGAIALVLWRTIGGHLDVAETLGVVVGHVLRGLLTIGIGAAAGALAASPASAAIVALAITLGTWALDYVAAARGGAIAILAEYTPSAALRVFERGEIRLSTILVVLTLVGVGLATATVWLREGDTIARRALRLTAVALVGGALCVGFNRVRTSWDISENRRNSFPVPDEIALRAIDKPLSITVNLAAEDPRLVDLERGVLSKLRRTMRHVDISFAASGRTGLFANTADHYGEIWYELGDRREMSRSTTEPIVLETIYRLAGKVPPAQVDDVAYSGYPLRRGAPAAPWIFFLIWPFAVVAAWWWIRRSSAFYLPFSLHTRFEAR